MGRKSKAQIEKEEEQKQLILLNALLRKLRPGPYDTVDEFVEALGYETCRNCEAVCQSDFLYECQVCNDYFCEDCTDEHSAEETGF